MWGVGLLVLSMLGLMLVNLFGNITVTNQLNYTSMKNAVQAAMYDAVDEARYRSGFCIKTNGKKNFTSVDYLPIVDVDKKTNMCPPGYDFVSGEYMIDANVFKESLVRRFADVVNNNKDYQVIVQEVIEYPPKVSVRIDSFDRYDLGKNDNTSFTIVNSIDSILEEFEDKE